MKGKKPNKVLLDLANGTGIFAGDELARKVIQSMGRNAKKKLTKHAKGYIALLMRFLNESGTFDNERLVPKTPKTIIDLLGILDTYQFRSEKNRSTGQYLSRLMKEADFPELKGSSQLGQQVWKGLEKALFFKVKTRE
jgi:hypothetical protein